MASGREKEGNVESYIIVGLLGRFKLEKLERYHMTLVASTTDSGIKVING